MSKVDAIKATLRVELEPWTAPNFARRVRKTTGSDEEAHSFHVSDLDEDALEDMALAWVRQLYRNAGRTYAPFHKPAKAAKYPAPNPTPSP